MDIVTDIRRREKTEPEVPEGDKKVAVEDDKKGMGKLTEVFHVSAERAADITKFLSELCANCQDQDGFNAGRLMRGVYQRVMEEGMPANEAAFLGVLVGRFYEGTGSTNPNPASLLLRLLMSAHQEKDRHP